MYLCAGTFLSALKICKAHATKQKVLGAAVFRSLCPNFDCGDDDSTISAVFRGARNIDSYLQIMAKDLEPSAIAGNIEKNVIPLLDENKFGVLIYMLQDLVRMDDSIKDRSRVELVNGIKKCDLIQMDEIVLNEFLAGILLYILKNTDNLNKEQEVKSFKKYALEINASQPGTIKFIDQYQANTMFDIDRVRPEQTILKQGSVVVDVVCGNIFEIAKKRKTKEEIIIVIPVNTTFETRFENYIGDTAVPLVAKNTIHGQWITHTLGSGLKIADVDRQIENSLKFNGFKKCRVSDNKTGKQDVYPIASIANVKINGVKYYLVAISEFCKKNKASSNLAHIENALKKLIDFYDEDGQGCDMYVPLIGAGRSRTGMTLQDSYDLIKTALQKQKNNIYGRIHISILPEQIKQVKLED